MDTPIAQAETPKAIKASNRSTSTNVAFILGILSLACFGFITGIPAIIIGRSEMQTVDAGRIHPSNRSNAKAGMILGIIGTIASCLLSLYLVFVMGILAWAGSFT